MQSFGLNGKRIKKGLHWCLYELLCTFKVQAMNELRIAVHFLILNFITMKNKLRLDQLRDQAGIQQISDQQTKLLKGGRSGGGSVTHDIIVWPM